MTCLSTVLGLDAMPAAAQGRAVALEQLKLERNEGDLYLSAVVQFALPAGVEDVLDKGIAVHFLAEAELYRERWYWTDRRVAHAVRHMRLAYQPLTRRWRVNSGPLPIGNASLAVSLNQNFDTLDEALGAIKHIGRLRLGDAAELGDESSYPVVFRFRLDNSQLPRPFQIGVAGVSDWNLSLERSERVQVEQMR